MTKALLQRPLLGGTFASGQYALASISCVDRGLHSVRFMVINPRSGAVVSAATDKAEALAAARRVIVATDALARSSAAANDEQFHQLDLFPDLPRPSAAKPRQVSRRRREVFERSQGRCHYCERPLTLDGRWHVEHMVPRALDGTDEPSNLVAACPPCNHEKRDRTALEFVVLRGSGATS